MCFTSLLFTNDNFTIPWIPFHSHGHWRSIGQSDAKPKHKAIGESGEKHAVLDGVVGQEHPGGHDGTAQENRRPHSQPLLKVSSKCHKTTLS